jgi:hypothetical protein
VASVIVDSLPLYPKEENKNFELLFNWYSSYRDLYQPLWRSKDLLVKTVVQQLQKLSYF